MNDECVVGWNDSLYKHSHENLIYFDAQLLSGEERPLVKLACPDLLNGSPGFFKLIVRNAKIDQLVFEESVMLVIAEKPQSHDEIFALNKHLLHLPDTFHYFEFFDDLFIFYLRLLIQAYRVNVHHEWYRSTLR